LKGYILEKGRNEFKIIKIITVMKKSIFVLLASFCVALFFAMNVSINLSKDQSKSGLALKNIEALARGEGEINIKCCAGLWGPCKTASGAESKAPYIECTM